ncbi:hypothetical protein BJ912DRAFT_1078312, partial [Pholiota molesta]
QAHLSQDNDNFWRVELDTIWDVLGPFPIHAREQHFLSPAFPLNLSQQIDYQESWPSSYADGGMINWSKANGTPEGNVDISFPEIRWKSLRSTEGWAALQHHAILRTTLTIYPPKSPQNDVPNLLVDLKQGSYFALRPEKYDSSDFVPQWFAGNIYDIERAPSHATPLPTPPSSIEPTQYDLFVSGDYEIRLFGDPLVRHSEIPVQKLNIRVQIQEAHTSVIHQESQDMVCDFLDGYAFGSIFGIGIQSLNGWWTVESVILKTPTIGMDLKLPAKQTVIAPLQTRIVPLFIDQSAPFVDEVIEFDILLKSGHLVEKLSLSIPITNRFLASLERRALKGTFVWAGSSASTFLAIPPAVDNAEQTPPILTLHGAGVDIIAQDFWIKSLPAPKSSWVIVPTGRTSWGLDWHGPSTIDAWTALDALSALVHDRRFKLPELWVFPNDTQVVLMGHSNGGQGAWHISSRFPDRVLAAIPAAAYMKSQAYVPLTIASGHFVDPILRSILESSLTPDDNDLHVTNLVDTPILAIHGGSDENVPVWHSREVVGTLKTWYPSANVTFIEDPGEGHWYFNILKRPEVQTFVADLFLRGPAVESESFTLTAANPHECGSLHGWKIEQLLIPGRLARLHIRKLNQYRYSIEASNVHKFSIPTRNTPHEILIDDQILSVQRYQSETQVHRVGPGKWRVNSSALERVAQPPGRIQSILSTPGPITIIISATSVAHELSVAQRLAHVLQLYHKIDSEIVPEPVVLAQIEDGSWPAGNVVLIGLPSSLLVKGILAKNKTSVSIIDSIVHVGGRRFSKPDQAIFFSHPHPMRGDSESFMLFILYSNISGLERAVRLFPFRTGVAVPDWLVVDDRMDAFGTGGIQAAGVWNTDWKLSDAMSWY